MTKNRILIMGAAGRDFHNFNVYFRDNPDYQGGRLYRDPDPQHRGAGLSGRAGRCRSTPKASPSIPESELVDLIRDLQVDQVVFAYSDVSHEYVMHKASQVLAAGADFRLMGADDDDAQSPASRWWRSARCAPAAARARPLAACATFCSEMGKKVVAVRHPMPYGDLVDTGLPALCHLRRSGPARVHHRGARRVRAAHRPGRGRLRRRGLRADPARGREGGRRHRLGRRQQRPALLPARSAHRRR